MSQLLACASSPNANLSIIYEDKQCAYADPDIIIIADAAKTQLIQKLRPFADQSDRQALDQLLSRHQSKEHLFLIAQGSKPTPGYGFKILANIAPVEAGTLQLPVHFTHPDQGKMMAQVLTSPCLIIGVEKAARYDRIQADSLQAEIKLPK